MAYANETKKKNTTALNYPETHFQVFMESLEPLLRSLFIGLLTLLTRFTAHSASSGHTPPTLSPLFGPLLFGLGPSTLAFHHAYVCYLRATVATEHLLLSFIRWQDTGPGLLGAAVGAGAGASKALGVPPRLKAWIQGYPAMLPGSAKHERPQPRRGARTVRVLSVRRNVRMYTPDLVKSAASWAYRPRGGGGVISSAGDRAFAGSKEWERIVPPTLKLSPRYSDNFKKRMDLSPGFHPDSGVHLGPGSVGGAGGAGAGSGGAMAPSLSSSISSASSAATGMSLHDEREHGAGLGLLGGVGGRIGVGTVGLGEDRFRSLTDLRWGEFEVVGFGDLGADERKLQFDLTEGARAVSFLSFLPFSSLYFFFFCFVSRVFRGFHPAILFVYLYCDLAFIYGGVYGEKI